MAEVEVDTDTGVVRVVKMTVAVDAGTILNPQAVEGQLEGGMDQGVGYALREEYSTGRPKILSPSNFRPLVNSLRPKSLSGKHPELMVRWGLPVSAR